MFLSCFGFLFVFYLIPLFKIASLKSLIQLWLKCSDGSDRPLWRSCLWMESLMGVAETAHMRWVPSLLFLLSHPTVSSRFCLLCPSTLPLTLHLRLTLRCLSFGFLWVLCAWLCCFPRQAVPYPPEGALQPIGLLDPQPVQGSFMV